jgi:hypothetical protein
MKTVGVREIAQKSPGCIGKFFLHKFGQDPRLTELKKLKWSEIPAWAAIEKDLSSGQ